MENKKPIKTQRVFGLLCLYWIPNQGSRPEGVILYTDFHMRRENKKPKKHLVFLRCYVCIGFPIRDHDQRE